MPLIESGREIESEPVKLYSGRGQRAPFRIPQRSIVILTGSIPNTFTSKLADTLTLES